MLGVDLSLNARIIQEVTLELAMKLESEHLVPMR